MHLWVSPSLPTESSSPGLPVWVPRGRTRLRLVTVFKRPYADADNQHETTRAWAVIPEGADARKSKAGTRFTSITRSSGFESGRLSKTTSPAPTDGRRR